MGRPSQVRPRLPTRLPTRLDDLSVEEVDAAAKIIVEVGVDPRVDP
ncbi:hypothetical protein Ae406Ps2_6415c [Pseudonocardia sp. Ae406_Ps2]|nr:hypothetical protein Ae406Ps2_6415c [Pseudonocardia sp. Ae406_Ps2]